MSVERHTEPEGIPAKPVLYVAFGFLAFVGISVIGIFYYYSSSIGMPNAPTPQVFPSPQLQQTPLADLETLLKAQRERLEGYGWVEKDKGLVRIPIGRAMQILASQGDAALGALDDLVKPAPEEKKEPATGSEETKP